MSNFDPQAFLTGEVQGEMETKYTPVPEGDYTAFIHSVAAREVNDSPVLDVVYKIIDEGLQATMNMDEIFVRQSIFVDVDGNGAMQFGPNKNVKLGNVREACNQNGKGKWAPKLLEGAGPLLIKVTQRVTEDATYNDVKRVVAA